MPVTVTEAERASFLRCRRQWDFHAGMRQNLEPRNRPAAPDLDRAIRDALAVYYFPGMWDWDRRVRLPLVGQELDRALEGEALDEGQALLDRYVRWAPAVDRFAPVLVEADFEATVLDPDGAAVVTAAGEAVRYRGRIDLMAVDRHDAYWIVRHQVVDGDWPPTEQLLADDEALAACWAWEQFYLGMAITGTGPCQHGTPLEPGFGPRPARRQEEGRLGGRSWGMGRGAAPPKFRRDPGSPTS